MREEEGDGERGNEGILRLRRVHDRFFEENRRSLHGNRTSEASDGHARSD